MQVDSRTLAEGEEIRTDVCIIGAGAAGITIALELAGAPCDVCLLEAGGFEPDLATQALCEGVTTGQPYFPLQAARVRMFGGSTNHWGGWCSELEAWDFTERPWVNSSGWPIDRDDVEPFYPRAHELCQISQLGFEPKPWIEPGRGGPLPLDPRRVQSSVFQYSPPTNFGQVYRDAILAAPNVRTFLYANVTEIEVPKEGSEVTGARVATLGGNRFRVRARLFVLATGGIENPRVLLASRETRPAGVGNDHDQVGRYFMEHPHHMFGLFLPSQPIDMDFYEMRPMHGTTRRGTLQTTPETCREERLTSFSWTIEKAYSEVFSDGIESFKLLKRELAEGRVPDDLGAHLWNVITDIDDVIAETWSRVGSEEEDDEARRDSYRFFSRTEQEPNPDSRVMLSDELDPLGKPRIHLNWSLSENDLRSTRRSQEIVGEEIARAGLGRMKLLGEDDWYRFIYGGWHHMGTTRMSDDPKRGVVDRDCRVHGLANLYVGGSSVFSTSGWSNPTLSIVALAVRLAQHLRGALG